MTVTTQENLTATTGDTGSGRHRHGPGTGTGGRRGRRAGHEELVDDDLLVEDVSIDGMCGVY